jgi:adenine-specific DNA-methyltransferase
MNISKLSGSSADITEEQKSRLKELLPEVLAEGKIDWHKLKAILGEEVELGERYGLSWKGKSDVFRIIQEPTTKTLKPLRDESVNFDETENIFIEGDNLEALKVLQKAYYGKVKMIYIDPPYNTGNDFVYNDKFAQKRADYEQEAGLRDGNGQITRTDGLTKNSKDGGHYHSNWLTMMYPRLYLARNFLRPDGVIFVSIDDNEVHNLRQIMNEVFGEENFINQISVKTKPSAGASGGGEDKKLKKNVEYILCYVRNREHFNKFNDLFEKKDLFEYIGDYKSSGKSWKYTRVLLSLGNRTFDQETVDGSGNQIKIFKHSGVNIRTVSDLAKEEGISEQGIYIKYFDKIFRDTNAQSSIRQRVMDTVGSEDGFYSIEYTPVSGKNKNTLTTLFYRGKNKDLIAWLKDVSVKQGDALFKNDKVGTLWEGLNWNNVSKEGDTIYPNGKKPITLIQRLLDLTSSPDKDDILLDFFAGSGSTAHAVMAQNSLDGGRRRSISIQLAEFISDKDRQEFNYSTDIKTVADLAKERIRRAAKKIAEQNNKVDLGFKSLRLDETNFKVWDGSIKGKDELKQQMLDHLSPIKDSAAEEDLLTELALKSGIDLTAPRKPVETPEGKYYVLDKSLVICLETKLSSLLFESILTSKPERVILLDSSLHNDDQLKTNLLLRAAKAGIEILVV